ncbi:hypothetical protein, partial [Klebsiella pneumoniae]
STRVRSSAASDVYKRQVYRRAIAGLNVSGLKKNARDISLLRYMPA